MVIAVEHSAVRRSAGANGEVSVVGVDGLGRVDVDELLAAVRPETALVHRQWVNHEVGTTQPVAEAVAGCRERGVLVHVDAAQAGGRVPIAFDDLGADLCSVSGHKLGGPPGTGEPSPVLAAMGVDAERSLRASVGWSSTDALLAALGPVLDALRALRP